MLSRPECAPQHFQAPELLSALNDPLESIGTFYLHLPLGPCMVNGGPLLFADYL